VVILDTYLDTCFFYVEMFMMSLNFFLFIYFSSIPMCHIVYAAAVGTGILFVNLLIF